MNLYQISADFECQLNAFDDLLNPDWEQNDDGDYVTEDGEIITAEQYAEMINNRFDELSDMEENIQSRVINIAAYIGNITADIKAMKQRESAIKARREAKENTVKRLKQYLQTCMQAASLKRIDSPELCVSIRDNAESAEISDINGFIEWAQKNDHDDMLRYPQPEIRKSVIKQALQNGEKIPFTALTRTQSVIIK